VIVYLIDVPIWHSNLFFLQKKLTQIKIHKGRACFSNRNSLMCTIPPFMW